MCHQTVSLIARHLEAAGIPTVIIGSAQDIVETAGVPRFLFVDFPLGNPAGRPGDTAQQREIAGLALQVLTSAIAARTTVRAPLEWPSDDWRENYMHVGPDNLAALAEAGRQRREKQSAARSTAPTPR